MNGRRKRILTSLGSLSFATLPEGESKRAEIAFKRQLDKAKPEGESKGLRFCATLLAGIA